MNSLAKIDEETSRVIFSLRFILSVLIVMIHCRITIESFPELAGLKSLPVFFDFVQTFFSSIFFNACAVPLFFVFSGYLVTFNNVETFQDYKKLILKKLRSVFVPYVLWILIFTIIYIVAGKFGFTRQSFFNKTASEYFTWFTGFPKDSQNLYHPVIGQFWYLRDLMLMYLLLPFIRKALQKNPVLYFLLAVAYRLSTIPLSYEWGSAFLYFGLGLFFGEKKLKVSMIKIDTKKLVLSYTAVIILQSCDFFLQSAYGKSFFSWLSFFNIIIGSLLLLKIGQKLSENDRIFLRLKDLSAYSFWIFAVHQPWLLSPAWRIVKKIIPLSGFGFYPAYFSVMFITVILSLLSGIIVKKIFPKLFKILCQR